MDISIIVLTFNAKEVTLKMFDSLRTAVNFAKERGVNIETIAIDNASTDGVIDEVENKNSDWVKIIRSDENLGFSKGNNLAIQQSSKNSQYVLLLNPDITLDEDSIYATYQYMEDNPEVGLTTCEVKAWSGGLDMDAHRGFPTPWRAFCYFSRLEKVLGRSLPKLFGGYHLLDRDFNSTHEIDVCLGAFMLVRRKIGDKINWLPTDYFLNGEDVDFCYQIKELEGHKIMYYPVTSIVHYKGVSKGTKKKTVNIAKASDEIKVLQINSGINAMMIFYRKYYEQKYPWILNQLVYLGTFLLRRIRLLTRSE